MPRQQGSNTVLIVHDSTFLLSTPPSTSSSYRNFRREREREHVTAVFHLGPSLFGFSASFHPNPANCSDSSIEEPPLLFSSLSLSLPYTLYRRRRHNEHSSRLGGHRKRRRPLPPIGKGSPLLFAFVYKRIRRRREPIPSPCTCRCAKSDLPLIPPPPPQRPGESNIQMRRANL